MNFTSQVPGAFSAATRTFALPTPAPQQSETTLALQNAIKETKKKLEKAEEACTLAGNDVATAVNAAGAAIEKDKEGKQKLLSAENLVLKKECIAREEHMKAEHQFNDLSTTATEAEKTAAGQAREKTQKAYAAATKAADEYRMLAKSRKEELSNMWKKVSQLAQTAADWQTTVATLKNTLEDLTKTLSQTKT